MARRFPVRGGRRRLQWTIYNLFMKKGAATDRKDAIAEPTAAPDVVPMPPILPLKREWRETELGRSPAKRGHDLSREASELLDHEVSRRPDRPRDHDVVQSRVAALHLL